MSGSIQTQQSLAKAIKSLANAEAEERGAIFTRREVVEFILDLVEYTSDKALYTQRVLEPSFGGGEFLFAAVERLVTAYRTTGRNTPAVDLIDAVCAVELHQESFLNTSKKLQTQLISYGFSAKDATKLCNAWLVQDDFLLTHIEGTFTHIIGNPPYIRQESIPSILIDEYRKRYKTIYDRADIYVPFIERSLALLAPHGVLGFICSDRWIKNRYGGPLRKFVTENFHLRAYVDMVNTLAFHSQVAAYPAIFVIGKECGDLTRFAYRPMIDQQYLKKLAQALTSKKTKSGYIQEVTIAKNGSEPWLLEAPEQLDLVRRLEAKYPTLEDAGCKVGIGVATGADAAFIGPLQELNVEEDRKLPIVMTRDIQTGLIKWHGMGVVNPFADSGGLVNLQDYPKLKKYLEIRKDRIAKRHVAQKTPANWYRTIDRIYPALVAKPKLLIPDIRGQAHIVYDEGKYYPHHNLYYITADEWDLRALQAILLSNISRLFISTYSIKMRGGSLRFQAQYLRRIRIPYWRNVSPRLRRILVNAGEQSDLIACNKAVAELYNLSKNDLNFLVESREVA